MLAQSMLAQSMLAKTNCIPLAICGPASSSGKTPFAVSYGIALASNNRPRRQHGETFASRHDSGNRQFRAKRFKRRFGSGRYSYGRREALSPETLQGLCMHAWRVRLS